MEAAMAQGAAFEREAAAALVLQAAARGMFGRKKAAIRRNQLETEALREISAIKMQCVAREGILDVNERKRCDLHCIDNVWKEQHQLKYKKHFAV